MRGPVSLLSDIDVAKKKWDERSNFVLAKEDNLSVADLDTLQLYAATYLRDGKINSLSKPLGSIAKVLEHYGII